MKDIYIPVCTVLLLFCRMFKRLFRGRSNRIYFHKETLHYSTMTLRRATFVTAIYNKFLDFNMSTFSWNGMTSMASDDADKGLHRIPVMIKT
jgi:hypothetical protein